MKSKKIFPEKTYPKEKINAINPQLPIKPKQSRKTISAGNEVWLAS